MKTAYRPLLAALSVAALTFALAAGCDDSGGGTGADGTVKADTTGGDGTTGTTDGTGGTDTTVKTDGTGGTDTVKTDGTGGTDTVKTDGTGGTDTTVTPDSTLPAPYCGDTLCNGGESQLTCPADCGGTVTPTSNLCFDIQGCFLAACASATTDAELTTCANAAINPGGACPAASTELQLFLAVNQCQNTNCAKAATSAATLYACFAEKCATADANCNAGTAGPKGTGTCGGLQTCLQSCGLQGGGDCFRTCYAGSSQTGLELYVKINDCLIGSCASAPDQAQAQACAQAALNPNGGTCAPAAAACANDTAVVVADPTPDASGDADAAGDTSEPDATEPDAATDTEEDAGPMPDVTPTPDAASDASGSSGFAPFFGARYFHEYYRHGGRF